jgi:predicted oxidoreductase
MAIPHKIKLSEKLTLSRIVHGYWRLAEWKMSSDELLGLVEKLVDWDITSFDHADIYGGYSCEKIFGDAISKNKSLRAKIQLITKCGIKLKSDKYPERKLKIYDYSKEHIISSVEQSLKNFQTDYIDLLLFHRPAPFFDPEEAGLAIESLRKQGKVLNFGVSNFTPLQFETLQKYTDEMLVTNQIEISPYCLEHFDNGNIDFFLKEGIHPMAWSPIAGGRIFKHADEKGVRLLDTLKTVGKEIQAKTVEEVIYVWLLKHPVKIIPIVGSGKIERIRHAVSSLDLEMSLEQWYQIYNASKGEELP